MHDRECAAFLQAGAAGARARCSKPKVVPVLTRGKTRYSGQAITDLADHRDAAGNEIKIAHVLPTGSYRINPMDHIVQW